MNKTIDQAQAALASAKAAYLGELERDCERSEGSGAQERRREEHQQSLRDVITQCERDLEEANRHQMPHAEAPQGCFAWSETKWYCNCPQCGHTNEVSESDCKSGASSEKTCSKCGADFSFRARP